MKYAVKKYIILFLYQKANFVHQNLTSTLLSLIEILCETRNK
jgi:hypothetical protein